MTMTKFTGVVEDGVVRLPPGARLKNGTRVEIQVVKKHSEEPLPPLPPELEAEEAAFVRACRRRLNRYLRDEDA